MDMAKYRALFLEEATDHLAEMSQSLLALEKDPAAQEAIETVFRMAHSIKSMAASLDWSLPDDTLPLHPLRRRVELAVEGGRSAVPGDAREIERMGAALPHAAGLARLVLG